MADEQPNDTTRHPRSRLDVINFYCITSLLIATVAVAGVVGAAVYVGEFDEEIDEDELVETSDANVVISEPFEGEVTITWTDTADARHLEIRSPEGDELGRLDFLGEAIDVENTEFTVIAVYEDGPDEIVEEYEP
ncbi:hypothetical protein HUB97_15675 [Halorubraceae archaeon YAN]|nr:hypothetical protein [Halorubraceae archaeon YAN]